MAYILWEQEHLMAAMLEERDVHAGGMAVTFKEQGECSWL